jgi:hypothetical protein
MVGSSTWTMPAGAVLSTAAGARGAAETGVKPIAALLAATIPAATTDKGLFIIFLQSVLLAPLAKNVPAT